MKKILAAALAVLWALLLFSGCDTGISREERTLARAGEREARELAAAHFREKYGLEVSIESASADFSGGNFDSDRVFTGRVGVVIDCAGETYFAHAVDGLVYDNYQALELEAATLAHIIDALALPEPAHYSLEPRGRTWVHEFDCVLVHPYFDGSNLELFLPEIAPDIRLMFEAPAGLPVDLEERIEALLGESGADGQAVECIVLKPDTGQTVQNVLWKSDTAPYYAPYIERRLLYQRGETEGLQEFEYNLEPFAEDPLLGEFLMYRPSGVSGVTAEEGAPPAGWDIEEGGVQITPSYHFPWGEDDFGFRQVFIPPEVWEGWREDYSSFYLYRYTVILRGDEPGKQHIHRMDPDYTGYTDVALCGEYFVMTMGDWDYMTFVGIP